MPSTVSTGSPILLGELFRAGALEQSVGQVSTPLPPELEGRVASAVAELWRVPVELVTLRWGIIRHKGGLGEDTDFRLVGRGLDSWFAVVFEREGQPAFATRMRSGIYRQVAVATRHLTEGTILSDDDISYRPEIQWGPPPRQAKPSVTAGWRVRQCIQAGEVVAEPAAVAIPVIKSGERVKLTWRRGVVTVCIDGTAMHDAAIGERVHVRLKGRRGKSSGIVTAHGQAHLDS
jgi:flagella basal body P-ring formation protein FlgA